MSFTKTLKNTTQGNTLRLQLLRGGVGSVFIKLSYVGLGLGQTILLARILGPSGYGVFAYVFALVMMLSIPARFGLPNLLVRETARGEADGHWDIVNGVWRWSILVVCAISAILAIVAVAGLWVWSAHLTGMQVETFLWGLALVPLFALSNIVGAALRGLRHVVQGQLPEFTFRPILFTTLLIVAIVLGQGLSPSNAMLLRVVAAGGAFATGLWLLLRQEPTRIALRIRPRYKTRRWLFSTLPLAFAAGMRIIMQQTDIVMLGLFAPPETVGIYRVAMQGSVLVAFGLQAINMVVAPQFARMYRQGRMQQLQRLVTLSARCVLFLTLPVAIAFIVFGQPILRLVFGSAYVMASVPLAILSVGQLATAVFGSVGFLLNMSCHEKDTARGAAVAALSNIALNLVLIPLFGMNGAAAATAFSLVLWNVLLAYAVFKRIRIKSYAFHGLAVKR